MKSLAESQVIFEVQQQNGEEGTNVRHFQAQTEGILANDGCEQ